MADTWKDCLFVLASFIAGINLFGCTRGHARLHDTLLHSPRPGGHVYNPAVIPAAAAANLPIVVNHDLAIQQIINVDVRTEQVTILFWRRMQWTDDYLQWDPAEFDNVTSFTILPKHIWLPDIVVYNSVGEARVEKDGLIPAMVHHSGRVSWNVPVIYVTTCRITIKLFPYDTQNCSIKVGSWAHSAATVAIENRRGGMQTSFFTVNGEWDLKDTSAVKNTQSYGYDSFTDVTYSIVIARRPLFYEKNLVIPTFLINMLASLTFLLPPESGEKIGLAITVFLALCFNLILVSGMLPATSLETPILGEYYLMAITMVAVSLLLTVLVLDFHHPRVGCRPPPDLVMRFARKYIAPILLLRQHDQENSPDASGYQSATPLDLKNGIPLSHVDTRIGSFVPRMNASASHGNLPSARAPIVLDYKSSTEELAEKLDCLMEKLVEQPDVGDGVRQWQYLARILDRCFAVFFFLATAVMTFALVGTAKLRAGSS